MKEILIYGLAHNESHDYMEELLACFKESDKAQENIEKVKAAASAQGFHSFRVCGFVCGTVPDFTKAVMASK